MPSTSNSSTKAGIFGFSKTGTSGKGYNGMLVKTITTLLVIIVSGQALAAVSEINKPNFAYMLDLNKKYRPFLKFDGKEAYKTVAMYNINCGTEDGKYVPLMALLETRIKELESPDVHLENEIIYKQGEVRIIDNMYRDGEGLIDSRVAFTINKWGELVPETVKPEAILSACNGFHGPIWAISKPGKGAKQAR